MAFRKCSLLLIGAPFAAFLSSVPARARQFPLECPPLYSGSLAEVSLDRTESAQTGATWTRSEVAEVTGDLRPDVFQLLEGDQPRVLLIQGVAAMRVHLWVDENAGQIQTDFAVLRRASRFGLDLLATVGSQGLVLREYVPPEAEGHPFIPNVIDPSWVEVQHLTAGDIDGDGAQDLLGIRTDGLLLSKLARQSVWETGPALDLQALPQEMLCVEWDGSLGLEIALRFDSSVEIWDTELGRLEIISLTGNTTSIGRVRESGQASDALVVATLSAPTSWMRTLRPFGQSEPAFETGLNLPLSLAPGDCIPNGNDDLIVTSQHGPFLYCLFHASSTPGYSGTFGNDTSRWTYTWMDEELLSPIGMQAQPAVADFDLDGDVDSFCVRPWRGDGILQRNGLIPEHERIPCFANLFVSPKGSGAVGSIVTFDANLPLINSMPETATHLECQLWRRARNTTALEFEQQVDCPIYNQHSPISVEFTTELEEDEDFCLVLRTVARQEGETVAAGPDGVFRVHILDDEGEPTGTSITPWNPGGTGGNPPPTPPGGPFN